MTLALILTLAVLVPDANSTTSNLVRYLCIGAIVAASLLIHYWTWNVPARALQRRPAMGQARAREEMRRIALSKLTYGQLGFGGGAMMLLLFKVSEKTDLLHGWGRLWLLFSAATAVVILVQAIRKWRFDRRRDGNRFPVAPRCPACR